MTEGDSEAIQQATKQATENSSRSATWTPAQVKGTELILTFGQLSFSMDHQLPQDHQTIPPLTQPAGQPGSTQTHISNKNSHRIVSTANTHRKPLPPSPPLSYNTYTRINSKPQEYQQKQHKIQSTGKNTTGNRFVKISKATANWQEATRKPRQSKKDIVCFHCQRKGHMRRFCWQRIYCFSCGNKGHKAAKCTFKASTTHGNLNAKNVFKEPTPPPLKHSNINPNPHNREQSQFCNQFGPQAMNPEYGRPQLGDIYAPPRQANAENAYLSSVGLVVLLRGSLFHNLPRMIAENLAEVHGGHPSDFTITPASISPYLLICQNTDARDAVVRGGIYSIPRTQIQYAVHEWRPRFGMSYDSTSHQVWVKIVGLPLQAWSLEQINGIIRSFGQPLHVLPFGRAAGHFKDITALVATKSPARVPLAYTYRDGDYAVKIEVKILSWRLWDESHFPPPEDNPNHQAPRPPPQYQAGPSSPQQRTPSSNDSSAGSSEPTIDLSARSPKRRQLTITSPQVNLVLANIDEPSQLLFCENEVDRRSPLLPEVYRRRQTPTYGEGHMIATKNPNLPLTPNMSQSTHFARLSEAPHPISIKPPRSIWTITTLSLSLGEARGKSRTRGRCTESLSILLRKEESSRPNDTEKSMRLRIEYLSAEEERSIGLHSHVQPTTLALMGLVQSPAHSKSLLIDPTEIQNEEATGCKPSSLDASPKNWPSLSLSPVAMDLDFPMPTSHLEETLLAMTDTSLDLCPPRVPHTPGNSKQKSIPVRRSQRILEKRSTNCTELKRGKKIQDSILQNSFHY